MRKILISILVVTTLFLVGCKKEDNKEGIAFKESYEKLNGQVNKSGKAHREVHIKEDNPFVITEASEIVKMIENKETFYVYFGDPLCPWCRSAIEKATEIAIKKNIKKVYAVEIWDDEGKEILRDKYEIVNGKLKKTIEGTEEYKKFLEVFDSLLSTYEITNGDEKVSTGEKRIYAPNYIYVEKGVPIMLVEGCSSLQKDSREELTKEMLEEEEKIFVDFYDLMKN